MSLFLKLAILEVIGFKFINVPKFKIYNIPCFCSLSDTESVKTGK